MNRKLLFTLLLVIEGVVFMILYKKPPSAIFQEIANFLNGDSFDVFMLIHIIIWVIGLTSISYFLTRKLFFTNKSPTHSDSLSIISRNTSHEVKSTENQIVTTNESKIENSLNEENKTQQIQDRLNSLFD